MSRKTSIFIGIILKIVTIRTLCNPSMTRRFMNFPFKFEKTSPPRIFKLLKEKTTLDLSAFSINFWVKHQQIDTKNNYFTLKIDDWIFLTSTKLVSGANKIKVIPHSKTWDSVNMFHSNDDIQGNWAFISVKFEMIAGQFLASFGISQLNLTHTNTIVPSFEKLSIIFCDLSKVSKTCER